MKDIKLTYETLGGTKMENTQHFGQLTERMKAFREEVLDEKPYVDGERWSKVNLLLQVQLDNAKEWRDYTLRYFQTFSKQPIKYDFTGVSFMPISVSSKLRQ